MKIWHQSWLGAHPERSEEWLRGRLKDGFDVHHIDGDKANNCPENLVLIEAGDHMGLHGGRALRRIRPGASGGRRRPQRRSAESAWRVYFETQKQIWPTAG